MVRGEQVAHPKLHIQSCTPKVAHPKVHTQSQGIGVGPRPIFRDKTARYPRWRFAGSDLYSFTPEFYEIAHIIFEKCFRKMQDG